MKYRIRMFFAVILAFCAVAWLSGYNFDQRNIAVGYCTVVAVVVAALVAGMVDLDNSK